MSGLNPRACRMNVSRSGPCFRPQSACISDKCSLLSKGLRGGMSRSDRVVSLSRHMLQSARSWRPKDEKRNTSGLGSRLASSLLVVGRASRCRLLTPACWFLSLHLHVGSDWKSFLLVTFGDQEKHVFGVRGCLDSLKKMFCCVRCGFGYSFLIV